MNGKEVVVLRSVIAKNRSERKLVGFTVIKASPHIVQHITGFEFHDMATLAELIHYGYEVQIEPGTIDMTLDEFMAQTEVS